MDINNIEYERPIDNKISKLSMLIIGILVGLTVVVIGFFSFGPYDAELGGPEYTELMLNWMYILLAISIVSALVFPIITIFTKPKEAIKGFLPVIGLAIVAGVCYALGDGTPLDMPAYNGTDNNPETLKWVEGVMYLMYVLIIADIIAIGVTEIYNKLKR